ncbi:unnamed protein product [Zymoseptoria tritici ST99CH_3D1]|nr:unnamed protein product [Zymoseptoria tritici ST99CH_3D1]
MLKDSRQQRILAVLLVQRAIPGPAELKTELIFANTHVSMKTTIGLAGLAWTTTVNGLSWPWNKRGAYEYPPPYAYPEPYTTVVETQCTSTQVVTLPPETSSYGCPITTYDTTPCSSIEVIPGEVSSYSCSTVTKVSVGQMACYHDPCPIQYSDSTVYSPCSTTLPDKSTTIHYDCENEGTTEVPCETVITPTTTSLSTYQCTTTVTVTDTSVSTDTVISTESVPVPYPVPTTVVQTITKDGSVVVTTQTQSVAVPYPVPTTVVQTITRDGSVVVTTQTQSVAVPYPEPTTVVQTITRDDSNIVTTQTTTRDVVVPTTILVPTLSVSTVTEEGQTFLRTFTVTNNVPVVTTAIATVVSVEQGTTITSLQTITQTLPAITQTLPAPEPVIVVSTVLSVEQGTTVTSLRTITQSLPAPEQVIVVSTVLSVEQGTTVTSLVTLTQTHVLLPPVIISPPAPATATEAAPPASSPSPPPSPVCSNTGAVPTPDSAGCQGRDCAIIFDERAYVHWELLPNGPPLLTEIVFVNPSARQTCITTSCNSELFTQSYSTSLTSCAFPPCPSNFLDCKCNIVVGLNLPNGQSTSVTQIGDSGWNINLGPTATAQNVGVCGGPDGGSCVTSTVTTLFTNVVYTGIVTSTAVFNTGLGSTVTNYLLPDLTDYFPEGNPFGQCTTATLATPSPEVTTPPEKLRARQARRQEGEGGSKFFTFSQAPNIVARGATLTVGVDPTSSETPNVPAESAVVASNAAAPSQGNNIPASSSAASQPAPAAQSSDAVTSPSSPAQSSQQPATAPAASVSNAGTDTAVAPISTAGSPAPETPVSTPGSPAAETPVSIPGSPAPETPISTPGSPAAETPISTPGSPAPETPASTLIPTAPGSLSAGGSPVLTETVFYSQILPPASQTALSQLSELSQGASTYTGDELGTYICSVLGCSYDPTGGVMFTNNGTATGNELPGSATTTTSGTTATNTSSAPASTSSTGAAVRGRETNTIWLALVMAIVWSFDW